MRRLTPLRAIRAKCLDCCADSAREVERCLAYDCPLWEYRLSKRAKLPVLAEKALHRSRL